MGFIRRKYEKFKAGLYDTIHHTHFSVRSVRYTFVTKKNIAQIDHIVEEKAGFIRNFRRYNAMMGYCRGNRMTLFKMSFSARFFILMRPFRAYMTRTRGKTVITGTFRFSTSTILIFSVWILNDLIHLVEKLRMPIPVNFIGHIISLLILPTFLVRTVWKDKRSQSYVIDFIENELDAARIDSKKI